MLCNWLNGRQPHDGPPLRTQPTPPLRFRKITPAGSLTFPQVFLLYSRPISRPSLTPNEPQTCAGRMSPLARQTLVRSVHTHVPLDPDRDAPLLGAMSVGGGIIYDTNFHGLMYVKAQVTRHVDATHPNHARTTVRPKESHGKPIVLHFSLLLTRVPMLNYGIAAV